MEILSRASLCRSWMLYFSVILLTVSISEANYNLTVRFHEFRNPLGLQCAECDSGGPPACCDDIQRLENCVNEEVGPRRCDTRFRFILRPFGASVETAPTGQFPYFTSSNGGNSDTFNDGPGGFLGLRNPFIITMTASAWPGGVQFFIDALDRAVTGSGLVETEAIINRFPIDLELQPGPNFIRANYTGIYNISDLEFDISFRVQCLENYFDPNCTTFCVPLVGEYTCDSQGNIVCSKENREPSTNCTTCRLGYNDLRNCEVCLLGRSITTDCVSCLRGHDPSTNCTTCLPGYTFNIGGTQCIVIAVEATTAAPVVSAASASSLRAASGVVGAIAAVLLIALVVIIVLIVLYLRREKEKKSITSDTTEVETGTAAAGAGGGGQSAEEHDVENPIYGGTEQGTKTEEKQDLSENPYTELDHSPNQKPSEGSSFPYNTFKHDEDSPQKVDLAEQGAYDNTIDEPMQQTQPTDETSTANGSTVAANGTTHESSDMLSAVLEEGPKPSPSALAGGIYDIPPQHSDATEAVTSEPTPPDVPAEHEYAETEINRQPDSEQLQSTATYTNTTPGPITQEAVNHYDLGQ